MSKIYPDYLKDRETEFKNTRRAAAGVAGDQADTVGLAFSGGGIRSATFNLGVLQALARKQLLRRIDFLSTVSGGGYIGGFLGRWLCREGVDIARVEAEIVDRPEPHRSEPIRWLRRHGNYLAPNGDRDNWRNFANYARGIATMHLVLGILVFAFFGLLAAFRYCLLPHLLGDADRIPLPSLGWLEQFVGPQAWRQFVGSESLRWPTLDDLPLSHLILSIAPALHTPCLAVVDVLITFTALPLWGAYWLRSGRSGVTNRVARNYACIFLVALAIWWYLEPSYLPFFLGLTIFLAWAWGYLAFSQATRKRDRLAGNRQRDLQPRDVDRFRGRLVRSSLTRYLAIVLKLTAFVIAVILIDLAGCLLAQEVRGGRRVASLFAAVAALVAAAQPLLKFLADRFADSTLADGKFRSWFHHQMARLVIVAIVLVPLVAVAFAVHWVYGPTFPAYFGGLLTVVAIALSVLLADRDGVEFINRSSIQSFYGARLTRAFLGASNLHRWTNQAAVADDDPEDDIDFAGYKPFVNGGPLHLICAMVNETIDSRRHRENRDRRGEVLTVGPAGISIGREFHATWNDDGFINQPLEEADLPHPFQVRDGNGLLDLIKSSRCWMGRNEILEVIQCRRLALGQWIAISGAAITAGRGAATRWGDSLILGLANLRTGLWWNSGAEHWKRPQFRRGRDGTKPRWRDLLPLPIRTQLLIIFEFIGYFGGPWARYWYLSDGGYFENLGCYELIRRRVRYVIACDAAADPRYQFEDLGNLTRKVLIDFQVKIEFLDRHQLWLADIPAEIRQHIGELDDLMPNPDTGFSTKHAALARITYPRVYGQPVNDELPADELAVVELPVVELPVVELPVVELPVVELPVVELPVVELPIVELPIVELPIVELPIVELPIVELPIVELPIVELPIVELPVVEPAQPVVAQPAIEEEEMVGWLLYIKSSMTADEPIDVLAYKSRSPEFPQEPTSDQMFREAQWESYRALGEHVVSKFAVATRRQPFWMFEL